MRNEVLDRVLSQRDFIVESPTSAIDLPLPQTRLSPPEWIEVFRPFIEKGYYVYRIENKLILTAKRVLNPLLLIEKTYKKCETFKDRLKIEIQELEERIQKAEAFYHRHDITDITDCEDRMLLAMQLSYMHGYLGTLKLRMKKIEMVTESW